METLGVRLKRLREQRKLSVADTATALSISPSTYREWEYGRAILGEPYKELAKVFNVSLTELLTGSTPPIDECLRHIEEHIKNIRLHL
jgi:transcriptional regulator with XRE-family HTH domain